MLRQQKKTRTGIVWILLLPYSLSRTVKRREKPAPYCKIPPDDWCPCFDRGDGPYASFAVGRVSEALYTVPDGSTYTLQELRSMLAMVCRLGQGKKEPLLP